MLNKRETKRLTNNDKNAISVLSVNKKYWVIIYNKGTQITNIANALKNSAEYIASSEDVMPNKTGIDSEQTNNKAAFTRIHCISAY